MVNFGESPKPQLKTEYIKPISRDGKNDKGYQVVKQPDGREAVMSDKGAWYKGKREGTITPTVSMCQASSDCKLFDTVIECTGCGTEMLRRWSKCDKCGTER